MFKTKERIEKLEGKVLKLKDYCYALEKEQSNIYRMIHSGMSAEQAENDRVMSLLATSIENRQKAFEAFQE